MCRNLKSIVVQIGIEDYFEDPNSPEARKLFDEMVNKLQVWDHQCRGFLFSGLRDEDIARQRKIAVSSKAALRLCLQRCS